jgi:hypothetical protein
MIDSEDESEPEGRMIANEEEEPTTEEGDHEEQTQDDENDDFDPLLLEYDHQPQRPPKLAQLLPFFYTL